MSDHCPVCGGNRINCESDSAICINAERLAIERAAEILILENNYQVAGEQEAAAREELERLKNAEHITAEIDTYGGQPVLMLSAYDLPVHWRPGDIVRIARETPLTNPAKRESSRKED